MSKLGLVKNVLKGAKEAKPFYSAADKAAMELTRGKGTGKEFITELKKAPGIKPAELQHRKLAEIEAMPKMTKEEFLAELEKRPPAQIEENIYSEDPSVQASGEAYYAAVGHLPEKERMKAWFALPLKERERLEAEVEATGKYLEGGKFKKWILPGGEDYREILIKMPKQKSEREIADANLKKFTDKVTKRLGREGWDFDSMTPSELKEYEALNNAALKASTSRPTQYHSSHWENDPGVLAHARVTDRFGPNNEQILHIEEIQSDWHQAARKTRDEEVKRIMKARGITKKEAQALVPEEFGYKTGQEAAQIDELNNQMQALNKRRKELLNAASALPDGREDEFIDLMDQANDITPQVMSLQSKIDELAAKSVRAVPDAPFKKNWHELVMKRLLNYAAQNGYDKVVITPGAEQAKRYDLSKHINDLHYSGSNLVAYDSDGREVIKRTGVSPQDLPELVGKELADRLMAQEPKGTLRSLSGVDLQVGGEGMQGFYDKILPDYLNTFGKKYGVQVQKEGYPIKISPDLNFPEEISRANNLPSFVSGEERLLHSFDITPEMREDIKGGMPLYQKIGIPAGAGAAGAEMEEPQELEQPEEPGFAEGGQVGEEYDPDQSDGGLVVHDSASFKRGGKVKISDNPDAMFLELRDKELNRK